MGTISVCPLAFALWIASGGRAIRTTFPRSGRSEDRWTDRATHEPEAAGFLSIAQREMLDSPDGVVGIAEWEAAEAPAAAVEQATAAGVYLPVIERVAAPLRATRIGQLSWGLEGIHRFRSANVEQGLTRLPMVAERTARLRL